MNHTFDIICMLNNSEKYIEGIITSFSFTSALFLLMNQNGIASSVFMIYCRRGDGNLIFMGRYDGLTVLIHQGIRLRGILRISEEKDFSYSEKGFRRVSLSGFPATFSF